MRKGNPMSVSSRRADAIIAELAQHQHGAMNRSQLLERQLSERQVDHRLGTGRLVDLGHSVYAVPSAPPTHLRQYKAAELAVPGAAICALAASVLSGAGAARSAKPEIAVHPSSNHRCGLARVHRRRDVAVTTVWAAARGRADVGIPAWKVLVEVDGRSWHARLRDFDRDRERDNLAVANGWVVLRFTALHLREDPVRVMELIVQTGAVRAES